MKKLDRLMELVEDWRFFLWRDGLMKAVPRVSRQIVELPYRHLRFVILARSLTEPLPSLKAKIDLEIRPYQPSDEPLVRQIDCPSEAKLCGRRFQEGHTGLVAFSRGQLAGYAWGCAQMNPRLERVPLQLKPGDVLCTDVYANPALRGLGVQTALCLARFHAFRDMGFRRAICYIERNNAPSRAVWEKKFASSMVGTIDFLRVGPWYRVQCAETAAPGTITQTNRELGR